MSNHLVKHQPAFGYRAYALRALCGGVCVMAMALVSSTSAYAAGTAANTPISNSAQVTYSVGASSITVNSNTTTLNVAELLDVNVTVQTPAVSVAPGATQRAIVMRVTNTGNGSEVFRLIGNSVIAADDFDPIAASPFIYFDTDSSGDLSAADVAYVPGSNDPTLLADQFVTVLIVNNIPTGLANAAVGRTQITAQALTGTGPAGTLFAGQGTGGVDAVVGTSGATQIGTGSYIVAGLQLNAVKTQAVVDQFGGTRPVPGARINYQVVVTPTGTGTALGTVFTDAIPANTTYIPGSLSLNSAAITDVVDADAGQFIASPAQVRVTLGDLTQASGAQTISFAVTIN
jgi:uncharacterized repeat protein (TIGR01451 family)